MDQLETMELWVPELYPVAAEAAKYMQYLTKLTIDCTGQLPPPAVVDLMSAIVAAGITLPNCDMAVLNVRPGS